MPNTKYGDKAFEGATGKTREKLVVGVQRYLGAERSTIFFEVENNQDHKKIFDGGVKWIQSRKDYTGVKTLEY